MARKILLADDSVTAQNMGRKILADAGYEVITVNNGSAALKKIAELKPELIILDVYMPGYSGLEVCQRLKDAAETARVPVLLTVGKLEPFKPEEAKRVRAEGYIVKPFEASELLSALSKLEDKIVPKAEAGKPGRLGRAVAGMDDADRPGDEPVAEGSWKNRISFPPKKKEGAEQNPDDGALYNAVNRDLKTVVQRDEPKTQSAPAVEVKQNQSEQPQAKAVKAEEKLVDLGALATTGLPKDVTTEEIAALAAAAAHVQGRKLEAESAPKATVEATKAEEKLVPIEQVPEAAAETNGPVAQSPESLADAGPSEAEVTAAIARLEQEEERAPGTAEQPSGEHKDLPVTMAASPISQEADGSRWTAVSVTVDAQEAALSLEHEMHKAFGAFAAAAATQAGPATVALETHAPEISPVMPEAATESLVPVDGATATTTEPAPPVAAEVAAEASCTQVAEFAVAPGQEIADHSEPPDYSAAVEIPITEDATAEPVAAEHAVGTSAEVVEARQATIQEEARQEHSGALADQLVTTGSTGTISGDLVPEQTISSEVILADGPHDSAPEQQQPIVAEAQAGEPTEISQAVAQDVVAQDMVAQDVVAQDVVAQEVVPQDEGPQSVVAESAVPQSAVAQSEAVRDEVPRGAPQNQETELAATTAAAWASWRQIRDSVPEAKKQSAGESTNHEQTPDSAPALATAALAVAAGAETSPSEALAAAADANSKTVASIVDNLLAELRPRIVEEISRKLAEKK